MSDGRQPGCCKYLSDNCDVVALCSCHGTRQFKADNALLSAGTRRCCFCDGLPSRGGPESASTHGEGSEVMYIAGSVGNTVILLVFGQHACSGCLK